MQAEKELTKARAEQQPVKCVVWDLDDTIWNGVLLEGDEVTLADGIREIIVELDRRGILNSISSRNDHETAVAKLRELGIEEYFLHPRINWSSKSSNVAAIAESLNIALDTFAFVDDQPFEREEVAHAHPQVLCFDAAEPRQLLDHPRMKPRFVTSETHLRRRMYLADNRRKEAENDFEGASEEFLASLDMDFDVRFASEEDLQRAEELTVRTHQLNTTGYTYSYDELDAFRRSPDHLLLVSSLKDKYGTYGTIGLAMVEKGSPHWALKLLLMSCRVMSRGVGSIMLSYVMRLAQDAGAGLRAEYIPNGRNRMMLVTYRFSGFKEVDRQGDLVVFENDLATIPEYPGYLKISLPDRAPSHEAATV